jgi:zinc protease
MERLLTGRRIGLSFGVDEDAYVLSGATNRPIFPISCACSPPSSPIPRWDPALFRRFQTSAIESFDLQFATASARGQRELSALIRPNDRRFEPLSREALAAATPEALQAFFAPRLAKGPVHAVIVGDVTLDRAVDAMRARRRLPARTTPAPPADPDRAAAPAQSRSRCASPTLAIRRRPS